MFKWGYWIEYLISPLLIIWNFTINRKYTFKSVNNINVEMCLILLFYAVFTPVSTILGYVATERGRMDIWLKLLLCYQTLY